MKSLFSLAFLLFSGWSISQVTQTPAQGLIQSQATQTSLKDQSTRPLPGTWQTGSLIAPQTAFGGTEPCATHQLNEAYWQSLGLLEEFNQSYMISAQNAVNLAFPETSGVNEIAVIFHVVHNPNNPSENVSNAAIMALFQELQDDFLLLNSDAASARNFPPFNFVPVDCNINFCLATQTEAGAPLAELGVVRVSTTEDYYDKDNGEENKMKSSATGGSTIWNRNKYLNIWICDITNGATSGVAGYAYRPTPTLLPGASIDGVVIDYNLGMGGNVLTHEVGHYLGLDHTWGGSGGCGNDDGFGDTPATEGPSNQSSTNDYQASCTGSQQTCAGTETQYENYMDYANCTVMFTQEQANYMLSILQGVRSSLLLSPGCDPTNTPPNSAFTSIPVPPSPVIIPVNGSVNFVDQSTNVPTGWSWTISGTPGVNWSYINGTSAASQDPQVEFYTVGTYNVSLAASNAYGVDPTPLVETGYVQVAAAATGIACDTLRNWDPAAGISTVSWNPPATGYAHGNSTFTSPTENTLQWAEVYTTGVTTDIKAIEYAPAVVYDGGGEIIWKVWSNAAGQPGTVLAADTVLLADIVEGSWNQIDLIPPASGVTGTFWVGYELSYAGNDTMALYSQITTGANNTTSWEGAVTGWETIATTTGGAAGLWGLIDVLTSTGANPSMDFVASTDLVCVGGSITVNGSASTNNQDYRWYVTEDPWVTNLETSTAAGNTFDFPYAPGNYAIYLFGDGSCITDGVYMPVTVNPAVTATVTPTASTCGNNNGIITVTGAAGGDGTYYYSLDGVNYQVSNTFANLAAGSYDVYVATLGDNCEAMYTVSVATSTPAAASVSPNQSVCQGGSASITATGGGTYQWFDGATMIGTSPTINVSPSTTTQYSCIVTSGTGCLANVTTEVTVNLPIPPVVTPSGATTICSGSSVDLTSSQPTGNVWSTTETSSTISVSSSGSYTVTAPDINGCSATSSPMVITVLPSPTINAGTVTDPTTCATATGSIQVSGSGTGDLSWIGTASGSASSVTLPYTIPNLAAGSYNITFVDGSGCTSNLLSQPLNDPTPPTTPTISPSGPTTFCTGGTVVLTSSYGSGNTWSTTETISAITVSTSGTYSVTYTDGFGCSATSAPLVVTVNTNPSAPSITANGATTFCDGGSVTLTSSQGTGNTWSTAETTQDIVVTASGNYTVTYTNANGCSATSSTTIVTVNTLPTVTLSALGSVCEYDASFSLSGGSPSGGTYSGTGVTAGQFDPAAAGVGTYAITYEYTDGNGCINSDVEDIVVDICIGIEDLSSSIPMKVYPNPFSAGFSIEIDGEFSYQIMDLRGRLVQHGNGTDSVDVEAAELMSGVYLVKVSSNNEESTIRIVKH